MADLGPGTMPRGKYPESPARAGSHALISRTPTPGGMLHANLGLPRPPPRNFQPPLPQQPPKQTQQRRHNVPPALSRSDCTGGWRWRTPGEFFHTLSDSRSPHGKKSPRPHPPASRENEDEETLFFDFPRAETAANETAESVAPLIRVGKIRLRQVRGNAIPSLRNHAVAARFSAQRPAGGRIITPPRKGLRSANHGA